MDFNMHQFKIKPNEQNGPVRMEVTLQNTYCGQVQRIKYFSSTDKTSSVEVRQDDIQSSMDMGQAMQKLKKLMSQFPCIRGQKER